MGRLGWPPSEAYSATIEDILIAVDGHAEAEHCIRQDIYGAQGVEVPPYGQLAKKESKKDWGAKFRFFARKHNARLKANG